MVSGLIEKVYEFFKEIFSNRFASFASLATFALKNALKKLLTGPEISTIVRGLQPEWRNWQTRGIQNPVLATGCGFKSHLRHFHF